MIDDNLIMKMNDDVCILRISKFKKIYIKTKFIFHDSFYEVTDAIKINNKCWIFKHLKKLVVINIITKKILRVICVKTGYIMLKYKNDVILYRSDKYYIYKLNIINN